MKHQPERVSIKGIQTTTQEVRIDVDKPDLFKTAFEHSKELLKDFAKRKMNQHLHVLAGYSHMTSAEYYLKDGWLMEVDGDFDYHHREYKDRRVRKLSTEELLEVHNLECRLQAAVATLEK